MEKIMSLKKITTLLVTIAVIFSLAGCFPDAEEDKAEASETSSTGMQDQAQELNLVLADLATLDTNDVRNENEFQVLSQIHEGLFRVFTDDDGNDIIMNAGAESSSVSDDGLVHTFTLRDHVWSDGVPVTAQHYVDSFIRLLTPENAFAYSFLAHDIVNANEFIDGTKTAADVGVKAIDDKTFEVTLHTAIPFFQNKLTNVCFFPIRLDVIEAAGDLYATDFEQNVFNGPFVIESRILENEMILAKNPTYWDAENVQLEKVTLTVVDEASTQSLLVASEELDAVEATSEYINKWQAMDTLTQISKASPSCNYVSFNQHTGGPTQLMNNPKVRLAFSLALNREEMNDLIYDGINTPAYGLIPPGLLVGDVAFRSLNPQPLIALSEEYDTPAKIQALLIEGIEEEGKDVSDLSTYEFTIISSGGASQNKLIQEYFKQTWESVLGVKVNTNILSDSSLFVEERTNNNYDLVFMGWNGDYNDPMTFMELWNTDSGYAKYMGGYSNPEFDAMFEQLQTENDPDVRAQLYVDMENNLIAEQAGTAPVYFKSSQFFVQNYVKNLSTPLFGTKYEFSRAYISGK